MVVPKPAKMAVSEPALTAFPNMATTSPLCSRRYRERGNAARPSKMLMSVPALKTRGRPSESQMRSRLVRLAFTVAFTLSAYPQRTLIAIAPPRLAGWFAMSLADVMKRQVQLPRVVRMYLPGKSSS